MGKHRKKKYLNSLIYIMIWISIKEFLFKTIKITMGFHLKSNPKDPKQCRSFNFRLVTYRL